MRIEGEHAACPRLSITHALGRRRLLGTQVSSWRRCCGPSSRPRFQRTGQLSTPCRLTTEDTLVDDCLGSRIHGVIAFSQPQQGCWALRVPGALRPVRSVVLCPSDTEDDGRFARDGSCSHTGAQDTRLPVPRVRQRRRMLSAPHAQGPPCVQGPLLSSRRCAKFLMSIMSFSHQNNPVFRYLRTV